MFNATFRRLLWKEFRMLWPLWVAVVVLCSLIDMGIFFGDFQNMKELKINALFLCAWMVAMLYGLGCAGTQFAWELESGTFDRLRGLPITAGKVAWAKLAWAIGSTALLLGVLWGLTYFWTGGRGVSAEMGWGVLKVCPLGVVEAILLGVILSMRSRSPLMATIQAGVLWMLLFFTITTGYGLIAGKDMSNMALWKLYQAVWPYRLGVVLVLGVVAVRLGMTWFDYWRHRESRERDEALSEKALARQTSYLCGDGGFMALCQHHWRQNRAIYRSILVGLPVVVVLFVISLVVKNSYTENTLAVSASIYGFVCLTLIPSNCFGADHTDHSFAYFAHHGVSPRKVWFSRIFVSGGVFFGLVMVGVLVLLAIALVECWFRGRFPEIGWHDITAIKMGMVLLPCWFACGVFFSILCRSRVLAWFGTWIGMYVCIILVTALTELYPIDSLWPMLMPLIGFAVVGYRAVSDRIHERGGKWLWTKRLGFLAGCAVVFMAWVIFDRVTMIPNVELPEDLVRDYQQAWKTPESERLLEQLRSVREVKLKQVKIDRPLEWFGYASSSKKKFDGTLSILGDAELDKVLEVARSPKEIDWSRIDSELVCDNPDYRYQAGCDLGALMHLQQRLLQAAEYYSRIGKPMKSLDCLLATIRFSSPLDRASVAVVVFDHLPRWSMGLGVTPELIQEAIHRVEALPPMDIPLQRYAMAEYYNNQRNIDRAMETEKFLFLFPWEDARSRRAAKLNAGCRIGECDLLEQTVHDYNPDGSPKSPPNQQSLLLGASYFDRLALKETDWFSEFYEKNMTNRLLSELDRQFNRFWQSELFRRLALTSLAIRAYQIDHDGDLPKTLDEVAKWLKEPEKTMRIPCGPGFEFRADGFSEKKCVQPGLASGSMNGLHLCGYRRPALVGNLSGVPCLVLDRQTFLGYYETFNGNSINVDGEGGRDDVVKLLKQSHPVPVVYPLPYSSR